MNRGTDVPIFESQGRGIYVRSVRVVVTDGGKPAFMLGRAHRHGLAVVFRGIHVHGIRVVVRRAHSHGFTVVFGGGGSTSMKSYSTLVAPESTAAYSIRNLSIKDARVSSATTEAQRDCRMSTATDPLVNHSY